MNLDDPATLATLVCPVSRTPLVLDESGAWLFSAESGLAYPVKEGVPVLLRDAARALGDMDQMLIPRSS